MVGRRAGYQVVYYIEGGPSAGCPSMGQPQGTRHNQPEDVVFSTTVTTFRTADAYGDQTGRNGQVMKFNGRKHTGHERAGKRLSLTVLNFSQPFADDNSLDESENELWGTKTLRCV